MRTIDLDQARAARSEVQDRGVNVVFGRESFVLPPELPIGVVETAASLAEAQNRHRAARGAARSAMEMEMGRLMISLLRDHLLGPGDWERFSAHRPSVSDLTVLINEVFKLYGTDLGESQASGSSSAPTGGSSRRTSPGSTRGSRKGTSAKPVGARAR